MFPLHPGKEMLIQFSSTPPKLEDPILEDLIWNSHNHNHCLDASKSSIPKNFVRKRQWTTHHGHDESYNGSTDRKKIMHRDIERQRRHEMSSLYSSLRALLPREFIKGKRSTSDHVYETVNYIKHLEKKIQELNDKRDELKKMSNFRPEEDVNCSISSYVIHEICGREKTEITHGSTDNLPLSKVLGVLLEQGLNVVSCVSTIVDGRLLHTIQYEAVNSTSIDPSMLRGELIKGEAATPGYVSV